MRIPSSLFFRPSSIAMFGALASAFVWLLPLTPGELTTGYGEPTRPSVMGLILVFDWYALIYVCMRAGEMVGSRSRVFDPPKIGYVNLDSTALLGAYTVLSAIGLAFTYQKILSAISIEQVFFFLVTGVGNELKENLYESYSAGVVSLRYLVMCALALSVRRYVRTRKADVVLLANVVLLFMSAVISSRLIFVSAVLVSLFLIHHRKKTLNLNPWAAAAFVVVTFTVLATLNYSRNSTFYATDGFDFWSAGLSSIVSYVGSPFQVLLSVASHPEGVVGQPGEAYRSFTDISETLNSNSAFVALHESIGYWAWPYIMAVCFLAGFAFAKCYKPGRTALLIPCGAILYASAELWRLDLFAQGIFIVWMLSGVALPYVLGTASRVLKATGRGVRRRPSGTVRPA